MFPIWLTRNISASGWLRDGDPKRESISLGHRSPSIEQGAPGGADSAPQCCGGDLGDGLGASPR